MSNLKMIRPVGLRQRFQLDTFFETGCYQGESMFLAYAAGFQKVISCDIDLDRVNHCRKLFPGAAVLHGESTHVLGPLMPQIAPVMGRTLFWLDVHFPSFYGMQETEANSYPLAQELRLIRENKPNWAEDVIAFDDLRVIRDPANPRYRPGELLPPEDQYYRDITLESLLAPFAATHTPALPSKAKARLCCCRNPGCRRKPSPRAPSSRA